MKIIKKMTLKLLLIALMGCVAYLVGNYWGRKHQVAGFIQNQVISKAEYSALPADSEIEHQTN